MGNADIYIIIEKGSRASVYGIGTYCKMLSTCLQNTSNRLHIIEIYSDRESFMIEEVNGIEYWYIPMYRVENNNKVIAHIDNYYRSVIFLLRLYIKNKERLIFHLNYLHNLVFAETLKKYFNCCIMATVHYLDWEFKLSGNISRMEKILDRHEEGNQVLTSFLKEQIFLNMVDRIICLSHHTYHLLLTMYKIEKEKIAVIYNGLKDAYSKDVPSSVIRLKYGIPAITPIVLFAGRLDTIKGVKYVVKAAKKVLKEFPDCHFIVAGNGDYDLYMQECGIHWFKIHFTGLLERKMLYEIYRIADIGLMPSLHEQCSYVAIEMMMHGVPLIASTSTGLNEMVQEGVTGFHLPVKELQEDVEIDPAFMAERIILLLRDQVSRERMKIASRKRYEMLYSIDKMGESMRGVIESLKNS